MGVATRMSSRVIAIKLRCDNDILTFDILRMDSIANRQVSCLSEHLCGWEKFRAIFLQQKCKNAEKGD